MKRAADTLSDYPPPGMEIRLIERYVGLNSSRVLEIGAGDGRLTRQVAPLASSVVAIEPDPAKVALAKQLTASQGIGNITFHVGSAERLRKGGRPFDVALFSWSL
jgi:protein-L-isoaspartate O-methyltransferase